MCVRERNRREGDLLNFGCFFSLYFFFFFFLADKLEKFAKQEQIACAVFFYSFASVCVVHLLRFQLRS